MVLIDFLNKTIPGGGQKTARGQKSCPPLAKILCTRLITPNVFLLLHFPHYTPYPPNGMLRPCTFLTTNRPPYILPMVCYAPVLSSLLPPHYPPIWYVTSLYFPLYHPLYILPMLCYAPEVLLSNENIFVCWFYEFH